MKFETPPISAPAERPSESEMELRKRQIQALEGANIPPRYKGAKIEDLSKVPADSREKYAATIEKLKALLYHRCTLAMLGKVGPGKTWMACAIVHEFCRAGRYAVYMEAMDYFIALQETYDDGAKANASAVEQKYVRPELLILDAMEERADTSWNDRMLVRLINKRYAAEKSTVLISNEDVKAFKTRVGDSIADRIRDEGGFIVCDWPSLRGRINHA